MWRDFFFSHLSRRNFLPMKNKVPFANLLREKNFGSAMKKTFVSRDKFVQQSSAEDVAAASGESSRTQFLSRANAAGNLSSRIYLRGRERASAAFADLRGEGRDVVDIWPCFSLLAIERTYLGNFPDGRTCLLLQFSE